MSTPNLDSRYITPAGVDTKIAAQAATDAGQYSYFFNVKSYGAKIDGTTDDSAAINSAITAASFAGGGTVFIPAGNVVVSSQINLLSNVQLRGAGKGVTTLIQTGSYANVLMAAGTIPAKSSPTTTVTLDVARGATTLTVASTAGISVGSYVLIGSSVAVRSDSITQYVGEIVRVASVDSGTQLTIKGVVRDNYAMSDSASLYLMSPITNCGISDIAIRNSNPTGTTTLILTFAQCVDVTVSNVKINGADNAALTLRNVVGASVSGVVVRDSTDNGTNGQYGYGITLQCATEAVSITNSHFFKVRHGVTTDGMNGACGQPRRVVVSGCTATETTLGSFDTHPAARDITFIGCSVEGSHADAFQIRSCETQLISCKASDIYGGKGLFVTGTATIPVTGLVIDGMIIKHVSNHGMQLSYVDTVDIKNVLIDGVAASGIDISGPVSRATISNNIIRNTGYQGGYAHGILFEAAATGLGHVITNNLFGNYTTGGENGIAPGGMRNGINIPAGSISGAVIDGNRGTGMLSTSLVVDATGTASLSDNKMLDTVQPSIFPNGVVTKVKAGIPLDTDFAVTPPDGVLVADTLNSKLWTRIGGTYLAAPSAYETWQPNLVTSGEETLHRDAISSSSVGLTSGTLYLTHFTARKTETTTKVSLQSGGTAAAATPTLIRAGLYTVDGSNNLTLVASTPNDTTIYAGANAGYTRSWSASYNKIAGQRYALGVLVVSSATMPSGIGSSNLNSTVATATFPIVSSRVASLSDLPSTIASGSLAGNGARLFSIILP